jgi:hypothetical protein
MPVTLLKLADAPVQVSDIFVLTVCFRLINFTFQIFPLFVPECLLSSHLTMIRLCTLLSFGSCSHCILVCCL